MRMRAVAAAALAFCATAAASQTGLPRPATDADYYTVDEARALLGRNLFFDPILSGNRNIACATCHHPRFATSDGVSLSLGEGAIGLGPDRRATAENTPEQRIARNSPALFNVGAKEFTRLFHDGRLQVDPSRPSGLRTPLEDEMVAGFDNVLSAQAMFPVLSQDEMAGHYQENDISQTVRQGLLTGPDGAWGLLAARVAAIPGYRQAFEAAVPEVKTGRPIAFTDIANAIADFITLEFRAGDSPFDRHLRGEEPLTGQALAGMELFYGPAGCAECHSGTFQTDHQFHAMAMPQIGPGKAARFESHHRDTGRMRVTGDPQDAYGFRTPSLRNVAHTAPYGHDGAYAGLRGVVRHMADPQAGLAGYDRSQAMFAPLDGAQDWAVLDGADELAAIGQASTTRPAALTELQIDELLAFLDALSDPASLKGRLGVPASVPSGLRVD
jgi:cytochrome c peroxidase